MMINFHAIMTNPYVFIELVLFVTVVTTLLIKYKDKIFDFDDEEIEEKVEHNQSENRQYEKGA